MTALYFYTAAAFGAWFIVGAAKISLPLRRWLAPGRDLQEWSLHDVMLARPPIRGVISVGEAKEQEHFYRIHTLDHLAALSGKAKTVRQLRIWLAEMLECPACFGTWSGLAAGLVLVSIPEATPLDPLGMAGPFALAAYTCATNFVVAHFTGLLAPPAQEGQHG